MDYRKIGVVILAIGLLLVFMPTSMQGATYTYPLYEESFSEDGDVTNPYGHFHDQKPISTVGMEMENPEFHFAYVGDIVYKVYVGIGSNDYINESIPNSGSFEIVKPWPYLNTSTWMYISIDGYKERDEAGNFLPFEGTIQIWISYGATAESGEEEEEPAPPPEVEPPPPESEKSEVIIYPPGTAPTMPTSQQTLTGEVEARINFGYTLMVVGAVVLVYGITRKRREK